jgi:energy-coupling factor transport system substrate-specific component
LSWLLASFAIVFATLAAGWLAYERSRPSARTIALVGTLAALAALGRDAFAALPDVKPITAMTFVAGYALGPLPGFTVGAIGMLASNVLLGEGSYTPWQMAAWGIVGLAGAGLGRLSGRTVGRLGLALACASSAAVAKEIMNVYQWTLGASHTLPAFLLVAGNGLAFDVTDVVSSFLFGLAFAPELARLLGRMRARLTVTWEPAAGPLAALALLAVGAVLSGWAPPGGEAARAGLASRQVAFLARAQNADGGFGGAPGQRSSELYSAWAALGLAAAGRDPAELARGGHTVLDAIRREAATLETTGDVERTILALHACGAPPLLAGGDDLLARLLHARSADGSFEELVNITSFAVFSLRAAGRSAGDPVVQAAAAWLEGRQKPNGGFGYAPHAPADVDDTAAAVQALIDAGERNTAVTRAVGYLLRAIDRDGGFPQQPGNESNAQSTAWAVQALVAAGRDPSHAFGRAGRSPLTYLESLVAGDGSIRYSRAVAQTPVWVTAQALTALERKPFPIAPSLVRSTPPRQAPQAADQVLPPAHGIGSPAVSARARRAHGIDPQHGGTSSRQWPGLGAGLPPQAARARLDALAHAAGVLIGAVLGRVA